MQHVMTDARVASFASPTEHLLAELRRIDLMVRARVEAARHRGHDEDALRGLYISDADVDGILAEPTGIPSWAGAATGEDQLALARLQEFIADRVAATDNCERRLPLCALRSLFDLTPTDLDMLLVCAAPELSLNFERLFTYLQDDVSKRRPSVDLVLNLVSSSLVEKLACRARLAPDAPLMRHDLLELCDEPADARTSSLGLQLKLNPRILAFLLGRDDIDARIRPYTTCLEPGHDATSLIAPDLADFIDRAAALYDGRAGLLLHLHGPAGAGKKARAAALCRRLGLRLLVFDGSTIASMAREPAERMVRTVLREAMLQRAAVLWREVDALRDELRRPWRERLLAASSGHPGLVILAGQEPLDTDESAGRAGVISVAVPEPTTFERIQIWRKVLGSEILSDDAADVAEWAVKFRFSPGQIVAAATAARARARWRCPSRPHVSSDDIHEACRQFYNPALGELARKVRPHFAWGDLVLPEDSMRQLHELCDRVRHRADVLEVWGFARKLALGRGVSALFAGPSGTGKTMAAEIIAATLGLDLFKIDLSIVVSKYIGETEKNLSRVFADAETSNAILFFDEADALFGKRSEVKDAHDRYANVETSYLLQRMEEFEGISILATNLRRNMDEAFTRRLDFIVQFPSPEAAERLRIWSGAFPAATPTASDIDLDYMANQFKLSGGNIRNVALAAAFLATSEGSEVSMMHLIRAAQRELQKLGRTHAPAEFGRYAPLLRQGDRTD